jgi:hypothetical protein
MARIKGSARILLFLAGLSLPLRAEDVPALDAISSEVPDPSAVKAYRDYWSSLEEYENRAALDGQSRLRALYDRLDREENQRRVELTRRQLDFLKSAAEKYRRHLGEFPSAVNRQYVVLNFARILDRIASIEQETSAEKADELRRDALNYLRDFEENWPDATLRDEASAMRAVLLEKTGNPADAVKVWQSLAGRSRDNQSVLAGNIASGDHAFDQSEPRVAWKFYTRAREIAENLSKNASLRRVALRTRVKVVYRIGWASYKSGRLDDTVAAAEDLLQPHLDILGEQERKGIRKDAAELLGDALYEIGDEARVRNVLARPALKLVGAEAGLRLMRRQGGGSRFSSMGSVGEFLMDQFPNSSQVPWIADLAASGKEKSGSVAAAMSIRSRLGNLLALNSLWRAINRNDIEAIGVLDRIGVDSAKKAAAWYYEDGIQSGSSASFKAASRLYDTLLESRGHDADANEWRLRVANSFYFQNDLAEARRRYNELKTSYALDRRLLELTAYQDVLAAERIWKAERQKLAMEGKGSAKAMAVASSSGLALRQLVSSIDDFSSRFPGQTRSIELLLVGASACRDEGLFAEAQKYWQRVLVSNPTRPQRSLAIRGLVFAELAQSPSSEVVSVVSKFLRMEDWRELGGGLRSELEGVLSTAALDEGTRLNRDGKVLEAGTLLVQIASENEGLPGREKLLRDGAYLLALGGAWPDAMRVARKYLREELKEFRGDMSYLAARAEEFQLRLGDAAKGYLNFARQNASHGRSRAALDRAEKLAVANGDNASAVAAASLIAVRESQRQDKLAAYARSIQYAISGGDMAAAQKIAAERLKASKELAERFDSQYLLATVAIARGDEQQGIDNLEILARRIDQEKDQLGDQFASLSGRVNLFLGKHFANKLSVQRIDANDPSIRQALAQKMSVFDEVLSRYDRAAASGDRVASPEARYLAGRAAESMADDLAKAQSDPKARESSIRLKTLARNYFSSNLAAQRKNPAVFGGNQWMSRAALRLDPADTSAVSGTISDEVPLSTGAEMPFQWQM